MSARIDAVIAGAVALAGIYERENALDRHTSNQGASPGMSAIDAGDRSAPASRTPAVIWVLTLLFAAKAFVSVVGAFLFAFPMEGPLGSIVGVLLIVAGVVYAIIAWRMRLGERVIWLAALIVSIVHQAGLAVLDLVLYGAIPSGDYLFIGVTLVVVILLFLPVTRRFFSR